MIYNNITLVANNIDEAFLKWYNLLTENIQECESRDGEVVGEHDGIMYYTIGQRHGLGLGGEGDPWFVLGKDVKRNVLLVGRGGNNEYLYSNRCIVSNINWLGEPFDKREINVKFRYRSQDIKATLIDLKDGRFEIQYPQMFKAVTPGQAAVFYDGDEMLGGSTIDEVFMNQEKRRY